MLINDIIVTFVVYVQRSDSSVAELARVVLEKKAVPDIIGIIFDVVLFFVRRIVGWISGIPYT